MKNIYRLVFIIVSVSCLVLLISNKNHKKQIKDEGEIISDISMLAYNLHEGNIKSIYYDNLALTDSNIFFSYYKIGEGQLKCYSDIDCKKELGDQNMKIIKDLGILYIVVEKENGFIDIQMYNPTLRNSQHYYYLYEQQDPKDFFKQLGVDYNKMEKNINIIDNNLLYIQFKL